MARDFFRILNDSKGNLCSAEKPEEDLKKVMVFDSETKVIYYLITERKSLFSPSLFETRLAPYISENGKHCRFIDNQIVEIG